MDRFNNLVEEFVPDDGKPYDRQTVLKLMEVAFHLGKNCVLKPITEDLKQLTQKPQA